LHQQQKSANITGQNSIIWCCTDRPHSSMQQSKIFI